MTNEQDDDLIMSLLIREREKLTRSLNLDIKIWEDRPPSAGFDRAKNISERRDEINRVEAEIERRS